MKNEPKNEPTFHCLNRSGRATRSAWQAAVVVSLLCWTGTPADAGILRPLREGLSHLFQRSTRASADDAGSAAARGLRQGAKVADDAADLARRRYPAAVRTLEKAGKKPDEVFRLTARYGDEALWVIQRPRQLAIFYRHGDDAMQAMLRHRGLASGMIERFGLPGARAVGRLAPQNARRLEMLSRNTRLLTGKQGQPLLQVLEQHGDRAMDFIWRHKGTLAVGTVLAAFVADPVPFLDGTRQLAEVATRSIAAPLAEAAGEGARQVAHEAATRTNWTLVITVLITLLAGLWLLRVRRCGPIRQCFRNRPHTAGSAPT